LEWQHPVFKPEPSFKMFAEAHTKNNPWLHRFALLTAVVTFLLLGLGGLVTSKEAGMSVPDWPTSYGYNMFALPVKFWKGGAFFEHTHRLLASAAGLLTTILAVWLWLKEPRKWMKWLGVIAFLLVVAQGVLGGLRVTMKMDSLGIYHGVIAQSFFLLVSAIALFTSGFWTGLKNIRQPTPDTRLPKLRRFVLFTTIAIFLQLMLGATMRHQHAGLAIPDFPTAYGKIWPDTNSDAIQRYNAGRVETTNVNPITAFQVVLQMTHRIAALAIAVFVAICAVQSWRKLGKTDPLSKLATFWLTLIIVQIGLGAWTIWSNKAADVATLHVMAGALSLVTGALWCAIAFGRVAGSPKSQNESFGAFGTLAANK
jgi:cytochrome c oxidase assembly protein subunit 15